VGQRIVGIAVRHSENFEDSRMLRAIEYATWFSLETYDASNKFHVNALILVIEVIWYQSDEDIRKGKWHASICQDFWPGEPSLYTGEPNKMRTWLAANEAQDDVSFPDTGRRHNEDGIT
jgi:hypothetical protein